MFELQKPKQKSAPQISKPVEIPSVELPKAVVEPPPPKPQQKELDWGDDDSMSFDAVSKLMNDTPQQQKPVSPQVAKSSIQFDTQELEFATDEQLLATARTFHTSPSKETKDEHLSFFWFDAYEDSVAQPGKLFLFGKTPLVTNEKSSNKTFVSICLIVDNIPKQVFFIPRPNVIHFDDFPLLTSSFRLI